jgi:hypothetical protein
MAASTRGSNKMTGPLTPSPLFERIERARRRQRKIQDTQITLAHGSGGKATHELVEGLFLEYLGNPEKGRSPLGRKDTKLHQVSECSMLWALCCFVP